MMKRTRIPSEEVMNGLSPRGPLTVAHELRSAVRQIIAVLQKTHETIDQTTQRVVASYPNGYELDHAALEREIRDVIHDTFGTDAESSAQDWEKEFAKTMAHMIHTGQGIY